MFMAMAKKVHCNDGCGDIRGGRIAGSFIICNGILDFHYFNESVTDGTTDRPTNGHTLL